MTSKKHSTKLSYVPWDLKKGPLNHTITPSHHHITFHHHPSHQSHSHPNTYTYTNTHTHIHTNTNTNTPVHWHRAPYPPWPVLTPLHSSHAWTARTLLPCACLRLKQSWSAPTHPRPYACALALQNKTGGQSSNATVQTQHSSNTAATRQTHIKLCRTTESIRNTISHSI